MVFSSAIFLFAFLPVLYIIYRLVPGIRAKNIVLAVFSLIFYCFGGIEYLPLLLLSVLLNWGAGRVAGALESKKARKCVVVIAVILNLCVLAVFKYLDFFIGNINALLHTSIPLPGIGWPLGISFFTFTGMSYVIEVGRKPKNMSRGFLRVLIYMSMFPTIVSGPILAYKTTAPQIDSREHSAEKTAQGLRRFILGLAKKLLVAETVGAVVDGVFSAGVLDARLAWLGALGYMIQIYFDFSGYSDMAIGLGKLFGFDIPENFTQPYIAGSLTDFWKRWHISLTTWFRNYLYMPMVMSKPLQKRYKKQAAKYGRPTANRLAVIIPTVVVWLLTGLWHGPAWTYVLWGLWHGLFCLLEGVGVLKIDSLRKNAAGKVLSHIYTLLVILIGTVLFRASDLSQAGQMFAAMFAGWRFTADATFTLQRLLTGFSVTAIVVGIVGSLPVVPWLKKHTGRWGEYASYAVCIVLFALCVANLAGSGFQPFIYQQF